jgi:hypothetical protein
MKLERRDFIKQTSVLGAGLAVSSALTSAIVNTGCALQKDTLEKFGLQLYTLRDILPADPRGILKQVASFGYKQIESYAGPSGIFWGMTNKEFNGYLNDLGMELV